MNTEQTSENIFTYIFVDFAINDHEISFTSSIFSWVTFLSGNFEKLILFALWYFWLGVFGFAGIELITSFF